MSRTTRLLVGIAGTLALGAAAFGLTLAPPADAADHLDPSPRVGDPVGQTDDIADLYAWNTADDNLVVALTFGGPVATDEFAGDRDVLYTIHIDDEDADVDADLEIQARFGQAADGRWGVQIENLPGAPAMFRGHVGSVIDLGGAKVYTGVREDPFFFDLQGFQETLSTGDLAFDNTRDFFAGLNVSAIVIEIPIRTLPGAGPYNVWATTARFGG